jgi:nucleotide-binding universal stress UspA family protein
VSIKDVVLLADANSEAAGRYAVSVAATFGANLTVAGPVIDRTAVMASAEAAAAFVASTLDKARAEAAEAARAVAASAIAAGIAVESEVFEAGVGVAGEVIGRLLTTFDLVVAEQPNPDFPGERRMIVEAALFGSGRPLLLVPYIQRQPLRLERALVAWDGSATAARALANAMPFLARSGHVEVVTVGGRSAEEEQDSVRIIRHLKRHGIAAEFRLLPDAGDVASALLSHASDASADLLVMGGYGHSRLREFVLGGATRGILGSMTLPVLMSH